MRRATTGRTGGLGGFVSICRLGPPHRGHSALPTYNVGQPRHARKDGTTPSSLGSRLFRSDRVRRRLLGRRTPRTLSHRALPVRVHTHPKKPEHHRQDSLDRRASLGANRNCEDRSNPQHRPAHENPETTRMSRHRQPPRRKNEAGLRSLRFLLPLYASEESVTQNVHSVACNLLRCARGAFCAYEPSTRRRRGWG